MPTVHQYLSCQGEGSANRSQPLGCLTEAFGWVASLWRPPGPLLPFPPSPTKWVKSTFGGRRGRRRELLERAVRQACGCQRAEGRLPNSCRVWASEWTTHLVCLYGAEKVFRRHRCWNHSLHCFVCCDNKAQIFADFCQITHTTECKLWPSGVSTLLDLQTWWFRLHTGPGWAGKRTVGAFEGFSVYVHVPWAGPVPDSKYDTVIWATVTVLLTQTLKRESLTSTESNSYAVHAKRRKRMWRTGSAPHHKDVIVCFDPTQIKWNESLHFGWRGKTLIQFH